MATVTKVDKSFIVALGPFKLEVIRVEDASDNDTITSKLAAPSFAVMLPAGDAAGTYDGSASISGKTITLHNPAASINHVVLVFGDSVWS